VTPRRLLQRASLLMLTAATAGAAAVFLAVALFLWLTPQMGGPAAALTVAVGFALGAALLFYGSQQVQHRNGAPSAARTPLAAQAAQAAPSPPPGAAEALALARWAIQERPMLAMMVCAGVGYMVVRHPKAIGAAVAAGAKLAEQQLGLGAKQP